MSQEQFEAGLKLLRELFVQNNFDILDTKRLRNNILASYFEIGQPAGYKTDLVVSDTFLSDLPAMASHKAAAKKYAEEVGHRLSVGNPNVFYCQSERVIEVCFHWPMETAMHENRLVSWIRIDIKDLVEETLARCSYVVNEFGYFPATPFEDYGLMIKIIRGAIDDKLIEFVPPEQAKNYQQIKGDSQKKTERASEYEIEKFLIGKTYLQGFKAYHQPQEAWLLDPWDADYLGVSVKDLSHAAHVARARKLISLESSSNYARPSDKLITDGLSALEPPSERLAKQEFTLAKLPRKEDFNEDVAEQLKSGLLSVIMIDLDNFKSVNDKGGGHHAGDLCLEKVVKTIGEIVSQKGKLYRWGGDEFSICLPNFSTNEAIATAERIRVSIESARPGGDIPVTASIGVASSDQIESDAVCLFKAVDAAAYVSKERGKNRVTPASKDMLPS
jgi:diguanylate cyclase (GGDEF)-like protein